MKQSVSAVPTSLAALALFASMAWGVALANDIVIENGRVIDPETGLDAIRNIAVEDGRIVAISEFPLQGDTVIDATGHVVSPGFIDLHAHGMSLPDMRMQVMQGVTTILELESGILPVGDWYDQMSEQQTPIAMGMLAEGLIRNVAWSCWLSRSRRVRGLIRQYGRNSQCIRHRSLCRGDLVLPVTA